MSPYRIAYHVDLQNTPAWFEQRRPRTGTSRSHTSNILSERLAERVWYPKSQSSLLNIYFLISGFSSSLLLIYPPVVYHKQWNQNLFDMQRSSFKIGAAQPRSFTETMHAETAVLMCEPTPYPMCFSYRRVSFGVAECTCFIPPEQIMKSNLVYSCYFSDECCQSFLSPVARNPHILCSLSALIPRSLSLHSLLQVNQGSLSREKDPGGGAGGTS